ASAYGTNDHGDPGSSTPSRSASPTPSPDRSSPSAAPSSIRQPSKPKHTPFVERPPRTPSTIRHGQIASQLHDSRYSPATRQSTPLLNHPSGYVVRVPAPERPNPEHPSLNPVDKAKDVVTGVAHPVDTTKDLAEEAERGASARTPLIAL